MSSEWRSATIEEIAEKIAMGPFGSNIKVNTFVEDGVPIISGAHLRGVRLHDGDFNFVTEEHAARLTNSNVFRGDIIFTHAGNIGQVAYIPINSRYSRYVISQRQFYLRCDLSSAAPEFITYFFHSRDGQHKLLANASQTGVPSIARPSSYLKSLEFSLPPLAEQKAIAHILGTLDDKIELNRKTNETLEAMAKALFKSWFVDFDPVRAKAEGRPTGLPDEVSDLFPDSFEDSELGEIPSGWEVQSIGEISINYDSKRVPVSGNDRAKRKGTFPYYGATGIVDWIDDFLFDGTYLLIGEDGSVEKDDGTAFSQYVSGKIWVNNHAHVVIGTNGVTTEQLYLYLQFIQVAPYVTGAVQLKISQGRLNSIPVVVAPIALNNYFSGIVQELFGQRIAIEREQSSLALIRDTLLPKLISGEIRIPDAEKLLEEVGI